MPIEKGIEPPAGLGALGDDLAVPESETAEITPIPEEDGGGVEVVFADDEDSSSKGDDLDFDANLADYVDEAELQAIGRKLCELVDMDDRSRDDWKKTYIKGLDLLGFKTEDRTEPWSGACGVFHPVLTEAVVRFQSQAILEIFPASGPVKTKIFGRWSREKEKQAERVRQEMNFLVCDKMTEFRPETETLLFYTALAGSGFRKTYYCPDVKRPVSRFVPAEDFIVPYGTTDLMTCPRYTQVIRMFPNDLKRLQVSGFYRDIDLPEPPFEQNIVKEKYDKLDGRQRTMATDERFHLFEVHADWDLPGFESDDGIEYPYVFTVEKNTMSVLAIRRNWREDDEAKLRRVYFVPYHYLPGLGFYGSGLIHLIGGIAGSATSILRQLVDAGTLSNLPGGLKARGMRIKGDDSPIMPGEFRDVDVPSGNIRDNITFLPYKEPSEVLHSLLNDLISEGRRLGAAPDLPIDAMTQQAPVGTTLALLERSMKVMSAVQARLHASLKADFALIAEIVRKDMPEEYEYETDDPGASRHIDFDQVDIIPVSDPNASSMAQRVVQYQAAIDLARQDPTAFDRPELYRGALTTLAIPNVDKIVKDPDSAKPMDPVSENMAILTGKPVKAFIYQDHESHIRSHMAAAQDPKILQLVGQSPQASLIQGAMAAHVQEHIAFQYRRDIEKQMGVPLPAPEEPLPEDVEVQLSKVIADAADRVLQRDKAEAAMQKAAEMAQDPVVQLQMAEIENDRAETKRKEEADKAKALLEGAKLLQKEHAEQRAVASQERIAGIKTGVDIAKDHTKQRGEEMRLAFDAASELMDLQQRGDELKVKELQVREQAKAKAKAAARPAAK